MKLPMLKKDISNRALAWFCVAVLLVSLMLSGALTQRISELLEAIRSVREGAYSHRDRKVILTAIKKHQLADLKQLVVEIDPNAFVIVQEAHQVLGDGFSRYSKEEL